MINERLIIAMIRGMFKICKVTIFQRIVERDLRLAVAAAQVEDAGQASKVDLACAEEAIARIEEFGIACFRDVLRHLRQVPSQDRDGLRAVCRLIQPSDRLAVAADIGDDLRRCALTRSTKPCLLARRL
jgi:hypothetical protein